MVNYGDIHKQIKQILLNSNIDDASLEAKFIIESISNNAVLTEEQSQKALEMAQKRCEHYPLQYIIGEWDFLDFTVKVGEGVLIPRPDTECVCIAAAEKAKLFKNPNVADICSGSGIIGIGVKRMAPNANVTCVELEEKALHYLKQNASEYAQIIQADAFLWQNNAGFNWNVIVSNPPYISSEEIKTLEKELEFEPLTALQAEENGLAFYSHFARNYADCLVSGGYLVLEIGYNQAQDVCNLLKQNNWQNIEVQKDYGNNDRVVIAQKL